MKARAILAMSLLVGMTTSLCVPAAALNWAVEPAYSGGLAGMDVSLAVSGTSPYIAYTALGYLMYATRGSEGWTSETVAECGYLGGFCSTATNPAGPSGIAYVDAAGATNDLRYAYKSGSAWVTEYVADVGWLPDYVSLTYDSSGTAMIAYCYCPGYGQPTIVRMARRPASGGWSIENATVIGDVTGPSIALDSAQRPHISFVDAGTGSVKLAARIGQNNWSVETVDGNPTTPAAWYTSLRYGPGDSASVAYFGDSDGIQICLKFARKSGYAWSRDTIAVLPAYATQYCSLALDGSGTPSIAYFDSGYQRLAFARKTTGGWFKETADDAPLCGYRPSLQLVNSVGSPIIAYIDYHNGFVKYAYTLAGDPDTGKLLPDGRLITIENVVTSTSNTELPGMLYVQAQDKPSGIQVYFGGTVPTVARGALANVSGVTGTRSGERCVLYPTLTASSGPGEPRPLSMTNRWLGGGSYRYTPGPPASGQMGVEGCYGVNNIGLAVRTWGWVRSVAGQRFTLDDGSQVLPTVLCPTGVTPPLAQSFVVVTGISSGESDAQQKFRRLLRVRNAADIVTVLP